MHHINNFIIKHKAGLINLAEEQSNVSRACKVMDVSRDNFYRYQELAKADLLNDKVLSFYDANEISVLSVSTDPRCGILRESGAT